MNEDVAAILTMERLELLDCWQQAFGRPPPPHTHASFMRLALAWQHQQVKGKTRATHTLAALQKPQRWKPTQRLRPGTRLVREWQGKTYHVSITASGFEYSGKSYRSLSAIAREITGTAWSGPAFFGALK